MKLFEHDATLPYPIEDVFALTVDLENAPHWHSFFKSVKQLTPHSIGVGSAWEIDFGAGRFTLEITDYSPPHRVIFIGSRVMRMNPNFTIEFQTVAQGTQIRYLLHPDVPALLQPVMAVFGPPYGRRDLARYFDEMHTALSKSDVHRVTAS